MAAQVSPGLLVSPRCPGGAGKRNVLPRGGLRVRVRVGVRVRVKLELGVHPSVGLGQQEPVDAGP